MAIMTGSQTMDDPRSGSARIIRQGKPVMAPQRAMRKGAGMSSWSERKSAMSMMPARMANCEGWKLMKPRSSQLPLP